MKILHHLLLISLLVIHGRSSTNLMSCSQTPYPDLCFHFVNQNDDDADAISTFGDETSYVTRFRNSAIRATLNQAMTAHAHLLSNMDSDAFDYRAKSALVDCLELYEDSIAELNRSMIGSTTMDHLTLLSASMANHQTCENGFRDFGISFPFEILSNFSKLVSNSLAIARAAAGGGDNNAAASAEWVELVQGSAAAADMVVAQDGSGDFRSISEAVAAAEVRKGSGGGGRFVIYVKGGVYRENVVIKKTMKNVMMIGDGIGSTIVTAMKNVQDGSTTFRSPTFG